jgi:hypothetical protein
VGLDDHFADDQPEAGAFVLGGFAGGGLAVFLVGKIDSRLFLQQISQPEKIRASVSQR